MPTRPTHTRRDALLAGAAALTAATLSPAALARPSRTARIRTRHSSAHPNHAHNLIFMVSDGMSLGTLTLADLATRRTLNQRCAWMRLWDRSGTRRALMDTASADSIVTDSSAAASTWGIGERINNGAVNFTPDNREPEPLLVTAKAHGKATALVTTTTVTHATPSGFIANVPDRGMEREIAQQIQQRGVDIVLGGGLKFFPQTTLELRDVTLVRDKHELAAAPPGLARPLLGLFSESHVGYVVERPENQPTLEDMTRAALGRLQTSDTGFVLQVEGGRVDHAAHDNDAAAMLAEQLEFDRTIQVVADWLADRDDTLLIVTTDHGNANPGMTIYGPDGAKGLDRLLTGRHAFDTMLAAAREEGGGPDMLDRLCRQIAQHRGIELGNRGKQILTMAMNGNPIDPFAPQNNSTSLLGSLLANHYGVAFLSPNHTSDHVECTALGPGSENLPPYILNTDLHTLALRALDMTPH